MARTQKDIVNYFPHDANACSGDTLTVLQSQFGNDGYAFWFKLLEKLSSTEGHYLDCRNSNRWQLLLAKTGVNELLGVEILKLLVEMQAIDENLWKSRVIWCQKLVDNIADVYRNRRRELPQKPIITNSNSITTESNGLTTDESTQSKVKYSKVNKYTENFEKFWIVYPKKIGKQAALKAFKKTNVPNIDILLIAIGKQKKSTQWQNKKYIPNPATWLNEGHWDDEIIIYGENPDDSANDDMCQECGKRPWTNNGLCKICSKEKMGGSH